MDPNGKRTFPAFARFGLIVLINLAGGILEQNPDQFVGGFAQRHTQKQLQLLDDVAIGGLAGETGDQLLDFLVLGEEVLRRFFLTPPQRSWRVFSII